MPGTAPRADIWVVVEHQDGWGSAPLTRTEHGVRVVMARPPRQHARPPHAWIARCTSGALRRGTLDAPDAIADWDLRALADGAFDQWGEPVAEPLLLICANGQRDRCCGHLGRRLAREVEAHDGTILTCTHLGGHRFAPTALLLPWGSLHGRLDLKSALHVITEARGGRAVATSLRGYSTLTAPAQVAEAHARSVTGFRGLAPLDVRIDLRDAHARCEVVVPGRDTLTVLLHREDANVLTSCGKHPEPVARWLVSA